jgi:hypothetical protein
MSKNEKPEVSVPVAEEKISLTSSELEKILTRIVEAAKAPVVTDREKREMEEHQEARRQSVEQIKEQERQIEYRQNVLCDHRRHGKINEGSSRCVYVQNGDFLICQACQKIIRRAVEPQLFIALFTQDSAIQW